MKKLHTVYDFQHVEWVPPFSLIFLAFAILGAIIFFYNIPYRDRGSTGKLGNTKQKNGMYVGLAMGLFSLFLFARIILAEWDAYSSAKELYKSGKYKIVEGDVENYHPMPAGGHDTEHFDVNSVHFEYSDYDLADMGYNVSASHGGAIKKGLYVQILYASAYERNFILVLKTE